MCGNTSYTIMNKINNQEFRFKLGVPLLFAKMCENRLRLYEHVHRRTIDSPIRRIKSIIVEDKKSRGRPKKIWDEQIKNNLSELLLFENLTRDMNSLGHRIHVLDY